MRNVWFTSLTAVIVGVALLRAGEVSTKEEKCCAISEKVSKVLVSWKAVSEEAKTGCPEEKAKLDAQVASLAKECPFGSRMPETLGFVKGVLASALEGEKACEKTCPLAQAKEGKETAVSSELCEAGQLKEARTKLMTSLNELAGYAVCTAGAKSAGCCAGESACCAAKTAQATSVKAESFCESKAAELVAAVRADACDKGAAQILIKAIDGLKCEEKAGQIVAAVRAETCDKGAAQILIKASAELKEGACSSGLLATAASLKASWAKAPQEFAGMCPQKRNELMASMGSLSQKVKALALMPETVMALGEGLQSLDGINCKMAEWAKAHPEALKDVPADAMKSFQSQNALLHEAAEILGKVSEALKGCASPSTEKKTETASNK